MLFRRSPVRIFIIYFFHAFCGFFWIFDFLTPHPLTAPFMLLMFIWIPSTRYQLLGKLPNLIRQCGFAAPQLVARGAFLTCYRIGKL